MYEVVDFQNQKLISLRWVHTSKTQNGIKKVKSRLVAKGFQEENKIKSDSPTCTKESLRLILNIIPSMNWMIQSIDIKSAFLQSQHIDRDVYVKPPKEAGVHQSKVWKLNTTIYGLTDASRSWYISVRDKLLSLGVRVSKLDPSVFIWHYKNKLGGVMCTHVDDFLFGG